MLKSAFLSVVLALVGVGGAAAACPSSVPGNTAEAIKANEQRVLCLQQEIESDAQVRQFDMDIRSNENAINRIQMERRFEALPRPIPSPFTQPAPFAPN